MNPGIRMVAAVILVLFGILVAIDISRSGNKKDGITLAIFDCILGLACLCRVIYELSI